MASPARVSIALIEPAVISGFLEAALPRYRAVTSTQPKSCFAVLLGDICDDAARVQRLEFGRNVRAFDVTATAEFAENIVPSFGGAYEHPDRGFWLDPADLLRIDRVADSLDLEILGSLHFHPDWHRLGPADAAAHPLSERPTPMDDYVFRSTGWPINLICYLECIHDAVYYTLDCWAPADTDTAPSQRVPTKICARPGTFVTSAA